MKEYQKIDGLYLRLDGTKELYPNAYRNPLVTYLSHNQWFFTEKIDGMNIRVVWDGHEVSFYGRTDKAQIPANLVKRLTELFGGEHNAQMFEQCFGEKTAIFYGEGYGAGIQKGGSYKQEQDFILFDVEVDDLLLERHGVEQIASTFNLDVVPIVLRGEIKDAEKFVRSRPDSTIGTAKMEGVVGMPSIPVYDRRGKRLMVKIKVRDYDELDKQYGGRYDYL